MLKNNNLKNCTSFVPESMLFYFHFYATSSILTINKGNREQKLMKINLPLSLNLLISNSS